MGRGSYISASNLRIAHIACCCRLIITRLNKRNDYVPGVITSKPVSHGAKNLQCRLFVALGLYVLFIVLPH